MKKVILSFGLFFVGINVFAQLESTSKNASAPNAALAGTFYKDVTDTVGIGTVGFRSTSWSDINHDGYLDLLNWGKLYLNNKNGTFTDITSSAGLTAPYYVSDFIDMNNDGWDDIIFLHTTPANNTIYINNGNNTFTGSTLTFTTPPFIFISTISIADVNNDKYPDLFVGQLRDEANGGAPLKNYFYLNNQNNGFTYKDLYPANMGSSSAVPDSTKWETRASMFTDYDLDGDLDLYVAIYRQEQDQLWKNDGAGNFKNVLKSKPTYIDYIPDPVDWSDHGTGCDWADYDNDGDMDLLLSNFAHSVNYYTYGFGTTTIWRNDGHTETTFTNMKSTAGIPWKESYAGAAWGDVNNDGLQDLYITCFAYYPSCDQSELYIQNPNHSFTRKSPEYGMQFAKGEADGSFIDYNNDGRLDLATGKLSFNFVLFKNYEITGNNWVQFDLHSTTGNAMAIGAKVEVVAGGVTYTQLQVPNHGALQNKGNRLFFGLGAASTITSIKVTWPNATHTSEVFSPVAVNGIYSITEGGNITAVIEGKKAVESVRVYPNPAVNSVSFTYEVTNNVPVSLELYSVLGERVVVISNLPKQMGSNIFELNCAENKIAPGAYTYSLNMGDQKQTGKIIISK